MVKAAGGPYSFVNTPESVEVCVEAADRYTFEITDDANDGLCCDYGLGSVTVTYDGDIEVSSGAFGSGLTDSFGSAACPSCLDQPGKAIVQVDITTDNYPGETTWSVTNCNGVVQFEGGPYSSTNLYSREECVDASDGYTFQIADSYGDGICCGNGEGSVTVTYDGAAEVFDGAFGSGLTKSFGDSCLTTTSTTTTQPPPTTTTTTSTTTTTTSSPTKVSSA